MVSASRERSRSGGTVAVVGAGPVMVVCSAGPLLLGGAALGAVGGALANPWLITVGAVALAAGTAYALRCRVRPRRGFGPDDRCPTVPEPHRREDDTPDRDVR